MSWMLRISFRGATGFDGELVATGVTGLVGSLLSFGPSGCELATGGALGGGMSRGGWNGAPAGGGGSTGSAMMIGPVGGAAGGEAAVTKPLPPMTCEATAWLPATSCTIMRICTGPATAGWKRV